MTEPTESPTPPPTPDEQLSVDLHDPDVQKWFEGHLAELRRDASGQRILCWSLAIAFVVGLAAHLAGYLLRSSATSEPFGLLADLVYALGFALSTGFVVAVVVQVYPEAKRRQIKNALDAYEAIRRDKARQRQDASLSARRSSPKTHA